MNSFEPTYLCSDRAFYLSILYVLVEIYQVT